MRLAPVASLLAALISAPAPADVSTEPGDGTVVLERILALDQGGDSADSIFAVVGDPVGRVLVAGRTSTGPGAWKMFVARFLAGGALDTTFGGTGRIIDPFGLGFSVNSRADAIAWLGDGSILVGGTSEVGAAFAEFVIGKLGASGVPVTGFGVLGHTTVDFGGSGVDRLADLAVDGAGRIVVVGTADADLVDSEFAIARLASDGFLDTSFSGDGRAVYGVDFSGQQADIARSVAIDQSGRILVAGSSWHRNLSQVWNWDFAVMRLSSNGALDATFGAGGRQIYRYDFGGTLNDHAYSIAVDEIGRIVVGGEVAMGPGAGNKLWAIVRIAGAGVLPDPTFGTGGWRTGQFSLGAGDDRDSARAVRIQGDGKILLAGTGRYGRDQFGIARLTDDGTLDAAFAGGAGTMIWDIGWGVGSGDDVVFAGALASDGRVLVAGNTEYDGFDTDLAWLRLANSLIFANDFERGDTSAWAP